MLQGATTFLIAILGCGEGEAQCQQVAVAPVRYESRAACMADQDQQLQRLGSDAIFPVVVAECRRAGASVERLSAGDVRRPDPQPFRPVRTASR